MEIEDYGIIGNLQTTALISKKDASIDFFCFPACDSPSVFARLLDAEGGGHFRISPQSAAYRTKQLYLPSSNVLQTRFSLPDGIAQVTDLMPVWEEDDGRVIIKPWLVRKIDIVRGCLSLEAACQPAFMYGLDAHERVIDQQSGSLTFNPSRSTPLTLSQHHSTGRHFADWSVEKGDGCLLRFRMCEGESLIFCLAEEEQRLGHAELGAVIGKTNAFWNKWIGRSAYKGRWREIVNRSALVLKLLTFQATGAIIASPTFSLPEELGGTLNWDYRFTWIRDAAFTVYGLLRIGLTREAEAFMDWIQRKCEQLVSQEDLKSKLLLCSQDERGEELHILYDVHGETINFDSFTLAECSAEYNHAPLSEAILQHFKGYEGSSPVRIGNAAAKQNQVDIYGELMDAIYLCDKYCRPVSYDFWQIIKKTIVNPVLRNWRKPDYGIWEIRGEPKHYVYSKVMCWVCLDRAIRLAVKHSLPTGDLNEWRAERDAIQEEVMERGWNKELGAFVQSYNSTELDAANLIMPLVFFIAPNDSRFISTLKKTSAALSTGGLTVNNLTFRYNPYALGVLGNDGTFCMCSFWLAEALCLAGKYDDECLKRAISVFEDMIGYANHLGLFSEEISLSGRSVGNFPQALTHLSLISAAFNINRVLESRK